MSVLPPGRPRVMVGVGGALSVAALGAYLFVAHGVGGHRIGAGVSSPVLGPELPSADVHPLGDYTAPFAADGALVSRLAVSETASPDSEPDAWLVLDEGRLRFRDEDLGPLAPGDRYPGPLLRAVRDAVRVRYDDEPRLGVGLAVPEATSFGLVRALFTAVVQATEPNDGVGLVPQRWVHVSCVAVRSPDGRVICASAALVGVVTPIELRDGRISFSGGCEADVDTLEWDAIAPCVREFGGSGDVSLGVAASDETPWRDVVMAYDRVRAAMDAGGARLNVVLHPLAPAQWVRADARGVRVAEADARADLPRIESDGLLDVSTIPGTGACLVVPTPDGEGCLPLHGAHPSERMVSEVWLLDDEIRLRWAGDPLSWSARCAAPIVDRGVDGRERRLALEQGVECIVAGIVERDRPEREEIRIILRSGVNDAALVQIIVRLRAELEYQSVHAALVRMTVLRSDDAVAPVIPVPDMRHR